MGNSTGKVIGVIALMIALGVAGAEVYQLLTDSTSTIHVSSWEEAVDLSQGYSTLPVNITFDTKVDDLVLFDFTCQVWLDMWSGITNIRIFFKIDGIAVMTTSIHVRGDDTVDPQNHLESSGMRYYLTNMTAGTHNVTISAFLDDPAPDCDIRNNFLTVSIYK